MSKIHFFKSLKLSNSNKTNLAFIIISAVILLFALVYSRMMVDSMEKAERIKVKNWASTIQHQAELLNYTRNFFSKLEITERKYASVWSYSYEQLLSNTSDPQMFDFFIKIISQNQTIPFVVVDKNGKIIDHRDPEIDSLRADYFKGHLRSQYTHNPPITVYAGDEEYFFYYKTSRLFKDLHTLFDDISNSFAKEVVDNIITTPVIITDVTQRKILNYGNLDDELFSSETAIENKLREMAKENPPILISSFYDNSNNYIFYESSTLLRYMKMLPYIIFFGLLVLIFSLVLIHNLIRKSEQNQVWWGMSKETAHQLGTPLSSLLAWIEYYKLKPNEPLDPGDLIEIEKDVNRLQTIAQRFSKIGSVPELKSDNLVQLIYHSVNYIQTRTSKKITYQINIDPQRLVLYPFNAPLLEWVIENICKNAVNAIGTNTGKITIDLQETAQSIILDISDTGKGIPPKLTNKIFEPGFTTKSRGWGLGLTLCRRIISEYHHGKILVKNSVVNEGTTIRIIFYKNNA